MVLALYRRYRPDTLLTVIGQEHVTEPLARAIQDSHFPQGFDVGPFSQLRDLAIIRAVLVLPQPRGPLNK